MTTEAEELRAAETATHFDAVVVGAGFAGMYMLHRLRGLGFTARVFEAGGGVGGTWYWNRYPGARCDVESMQYSFSFSEELDQEWNWSEKYAPQPEILAYANHVADRFDLRRDILFDTRVTAATFDETAKRWRIETDRGDKVTAQILHHGGRLPVGAEPSPLRGHRAISRARSTTPANGRTKASISPGLRVGVIGTGSSAIQSIPIIAEQASALTVFQRTATYTVPAWNETLTPEYRDAVKADYPALRAKARARPTGFYFPVQHEAGAGSDARRNASGSTKKPGSAAACRSSAPSATCCSRRPPTTPSPTSRATRSAASSRIRRPPSCCARTMCSAASGCASIPAISRPTICRT